MSSLDVEMFKFNTIEFIFQFFKNVDVSSILAFIIDIDRRILFDKRFRNFKMIID